jgi:uncharacterized protein
MVLGLWAALGGHGADPDGYVWEVAHNPDWKLDEKGAVTVSDLKQKTPDLI